MTTATLNLRLIPRRLLTAKDAAVYCGIPARRFRSLCGVSPVEMPDGTKLFDLQDLDRWVEELKAGGSGEADEILEKLG